MFSDSAVVIQYANALKGLNKEQALLALSYKNLSIQQKEQILSQMGLIASENTIQSELLQTALAQKGVSKEKANAIMIDLGLMNSNTLEAISQANCTKADLEAMLAQHGITGAQAEGIISALGLAGANTGLTASFGLLAKAAWSATTALLANPYTWIVAGLVALVGVLDLLTVSTKEYEKELNKLKDNLENVKSECSELESELKSCNDELKTTQERMRELEKMDSLTFTEKKEYEDLVATNNELERKIALLELEQEIKNREKQDAFIKAMEKDADEGNEYWQDGETGRIEKGDAIWAQIGGILAFDATEKEYILQQFETRKTLEEELLKAIEDENLELVDSIENQIVEIDSYLQGKSSEWDTMSEGISYIENPDTDDEKAVNEWLDFIADYQDRMLIAMSEDSNKAGNQGNAFNRLVDNWKFDETVQGLQDLGKEGKVTASMLNDPKYDEFINKLVFLGVIDSANNLEDVALAFNSVADSAKNAADSVSRYGNETTYLNISDTIDNLNTKLKPALDSLSSAYKDIFTSDGFTKGNIGVDMLSSVKESIAELNEIDGVNIDSSSFEEFARVLSDTSSTSQDIQDQFNSLASTIVYATSSTEISTENFEVLTKALEEMGLVDARKVLTDIKTAQDEIIAQGYDLTNMTAEQAEQFINKGEVALKTVEYLRMYMIQKELSNNSLSTSNDVSNLENLCNSLGVTGDLLTWVIKLKSALGAVENGAPIEAFRSQIDEAREKIAELSTSNYGQFQFDFTGNSDTSKSEKDYADLLEKETTLLEKQLEAGIITFKDYTDKRKSIIEDYYRQGLISAEDYYSALEDMYDYQLSLYDKVIDAVNYRIDKEIDALEKEKESIEDTYNLKIKSIQTEIDELEKAREKREQQVELEKALYEVEKARSQRDVKLYSGSDRGVIYTNDSKTLREAEENLENEKYESHISKLEEQIESLEKEMEKATDTIDEQINTLSDYADKWSDVADEYEHAQNDMLASQILGANYEEEILNQRMATLEIFKNNYIAAQNAMAEANRKVYESQVTDTKSNSSGSKPYVSNDNEDKITQEEPKVVKERITYGYYDKGKATSLIGYYNGDGIEQDDNGGWYVYKLKKYHTGLDEGYVGDKTPLSKDKRLDILQKAGNGVLLKPDEQLSILKNKELVLTEYQGINIADALWQKAMIPNMTLPNYNLDNIALRNNTPSQIVNIGDIHLHEVQNVPDFAKALQKHLPNISVQYNGKH